MTAFFNKNQCISIKYKIKIIFVVSISYFFIFNTIVDGWYYGIYLMLNKVSRRVFNMIFVVCCFVLVNMCFVWWFFD